MQLNLGIGAIFALLVIILAIVFCAIGKLSLLIACLFVLLGLARLT